MLLSGEKIVRIIKDQIQVLNLTGEEIYFIEHWIISKKVPLTRPLAPPPPLSPVRVLSLLLLTNCLLEVDLTTIANNYFGGNILLLNMIIDRNCGF